MKSRSTLILVLVVAAVAGLLWLDLRKGTPTDQAALNRRKLIDVDGTTVDRLELVRSNETIALEKKDGRWLLTQPIATRADEAAVNALLNELEFAQRDRTFDKKDLAGMDRAALGLAAPRLQLTVEARQRAFTLLVGTNTPTGEAVYLQVADRPEVFIVDKGVVERLDKSLNDLRDKLVLDLNSDAVTRVEIKAGADRVLELARSVTTTNAAAPWMLVQPLAARADAERVRSLLRDLASLRVQQFVSDDPQAVQTYELQEPVHELFVRQGASDAGTTLLLGRSPTNDATQVYAKRRGDSSVFTLAAETVKRLELSANDLRDRRVLPVVEDRVRGVELTRGAENLVVQRDGGEATNQWRLTVPVELAADPLRVEDLLRDLADLRATQFVENVATDLERYGLTVPSLIVTLKGEGTNVLGQLLVGSYDASNQVRFARNAAEPSFIYGLVDADVARLPARVGDLRTRQVAAVPAAAVRLLSVRHDGRQTVLERGADDHWRLVSPAQGVLNHERLNRLLAELGDLRAEVFVPPTPENVGAATNNAPTVVEVHTASQSWTLAIGPAPETGDRVASWSDPQTVFTLSPAAAEVFGMALVTEPAAPATNAPPAAAAATPAEN